MSQLDEARSVLESLAGRYEILGRLARGEVRPEDLPALRAAAEDLGLGVLAEGLRRLGAGQSPLAVLAYLVGSGEFPGLVEKIQALRVEVDAAAEVARAFRGRR
jgi:hypothetical protein